MTKSALLLVSALATACAAPQARKHHHEPSVHRFEDADHWAKVFDDPARDAWQKPDEVVSLMDIRSGMTVVDLGAGTGYFLSRLSRAVGPNGWVLALDVEPDMVRYMKERAQKESLPVRARLVAPDDPGLESASVDRVLVVDTWHHLPERTAYAQKLARGLKPGGAVVVVDFTLDSEHGPPRRHRLAAEQVISELTSGGLDAKVVEESLPDQYVVVAMRRSR